MYMYFPSDKKLDIPFFEYFIVIFRNALHM